MSPILAIAIGIGLMINAALLYDVDFMDTKEELAQWVGFFNLFGGVVLFALGLVGALA